MSLNKRMSSTTGLLLTVILLMSSVVVFQAGGAPSPNPNPSQIGGVYTNTDAYLTGTLTFGALGDVSLVRTAANTLGLTGSLTGATWLNSTNVAATSLYIDGYYPGNPVSYTIGVSGATHWMRNEATGDITTSTDETALIQDAIDALPSGGRIFLKAGAYTITAKLNVTTGISIWGEGEGTVLTADAGMGATAIFETQPLNYRTEFAYMKLVGTGGVEGAKPFAWHGYPTSGYNWIHNLYCYNFSASNGCLDASNSHSNIFQDNIMIDCAYGIELSGSNNLYSNIITGNEIKGARVGMELEYPYRTIVSNNRVNATDYGLLLIGSYSNIGEITISDNVFTSTGANKYGVYFNVGGVLGYCRNIQFTGNTVKTATNGYGIIVDSNCQRINFVGNTIKDAEYGFFSNGNPKQIKVANNYMVDVSNGVYFSPSGGSYWYIENNYIYATNYGINIAAGATPADNVRVKNNIITAFAAVLDAGTNTKLNENTGYITENSGTSSIPNTATSVTFAHGLSVTPLASWFTITFIENPTNTPGACWVTANATHAIVNVENDPGASNLDFGWKAIKP